MELALTVPRGFCFTRASQNDQNLLKELGLTWIAVFSRFRLFNHIV